MRLVRSTLVQHDGTPIVFDACRVIAVRGVPANMAAVVDGPTCFVDMIDGPGLYQLGESVDAMVAKVWGDEA